MNKERQSSESESAERSESAKDEEEDNDGDLEMSDHHLHQQQQQQQQEESIDRLERYGEWLLSIPRDDVMALQRQQQQQRHCKAYSNFVKAFEDLRKAHDELLLQKQQQQSLPILLDDVVLRILEFLNCRSLIQTSLTCHRYHTLAHICARQQQTNFFFLNNNNPMMLLRAKEQSRGIDPNIPPFVPIPMSGLPKRVYVHNASDPDLNGIYFCTGTNGNGFLFTKPRHSAYTARSSTTTNTSPRTQTAANTNLAPYHHHQLQLQLQLQLQHPHHNAHQHQQHHQHPLPMHNQNGFHQHQQQQHQQHHNHIDPMIIPFPRHEEDRNHLQRNNHHHHHNNLARFQQQQQQPTPNNNHSSSLKCIIAKRFSNETLLWYMSKEVLDSEGQISQVFSFWARLMYIGDAESDLCRYPSMTSVLSRNGGPGWQPLSTTLAMTPPIVELLDP